MQDKLIIFIQAHDIAHPSWVVISNEHVQRNVQYGNPDELAVLANNKEIIVIVPAEDVLLTSVKLPKMSRSKLAQALPYALEDQVIGDVETLHFIAVENQDDENIPVAIISKEKIGMWIQLLKTWQVQPDVVMSYIFVLPAEENVWHVYINESGMAARTGEYQGFAGDKNNVQELLEIALASAQVKPLLIKIYHSDAGPLALKLDSISVQDVYLSEDKLNAEFAKQTLTFPYINLLHGIYKTKKAKFPQRKKLLRAAAGLAAAWIFLLILFPVVSYLILAHKANDINAQIKSIYLRHFPHSTTMAAPRLRMEEKLKGLTSSMNQNKFFVLLDALGLAMKNNTVKINRLDFQNDQLTVELSASSSENFAAFTEFLIHQGWQIKQQNANLAGEGINAVITLQ